MRRGIRQALAVFGLIVLMMAGRPAGSQAQVTAVRVATVSPDWSVTLGPSAALRKGYWRDEGLDVRFSVVGPAATHVAALAGGSIQFSVNLTTDTLARAAGAGARIYAVMGSTNENQYVVFGRPGIRTLADLRGKKIAVDTPGGPIDIFVRELLAKAGVDARTVVIVPIAGTIEARVNTMVSGATDAAVGSIAQWPTLRAQGVTLVYRLRDLYPDWQSAVMATTEEMVEKHPAVVVGFIKGMIRAFRFARDARNEGELLQIARAAHLAVDEPHWKELLELWRGFTPTDGSMNLKGAAVVLQRERDAGRVPRDFTLEKLVRLGPLAEAQRQLGLRP